MKQILWRGALAFALVCALFLVSPAVTAAPARDDTTWHAEYFNNLDLSGTRALVREDATIDFVYRTTVGDDYRRLPMPGHSWNNLITCALFATSHQPANAVAARPATSSRLKVSTGDPPSHRTGAPARAGTTSGSEYASARSSG